jgi:hypothetical protein
MFHIGRSGSTVLADLLAQHPRVVSDGEIYHSKDKWTPQYKPVQYLRERVHAAGDRIYIFEIKFFHAKIIGMDFADFVHILFRDGFRRFVVLKRRNFLRKIISAHVAHQSNDWHLPNDKRAKLIRTMLDPNKVCIDLTAKPLLAFLEDYQRNFEKLDVLLQAQPVLRLTYEEDIHDDPRIAYGRVCDFLGIERHPVTVRYSKTTPFPLKDILANYAEVDAALAGTPFYWMLEE